MDFSSKSSSNKIQLLDNSFQQPTAGDRLELVPNVDSQEQQISFDSVPQQMSVTLPTNQQQQLTTATRLDQPTTSPTAFTDSMVTEMEGTFCMLDSNNSMCQVILNGVSLIKLFCETSIENVCRTKFSFYTRKT